MERAVPPVDERLVCRLAALDGAEREAIEATIALWPLAARLHLAAIGVINTTSPEPKAVQDDCLGTGFSLTDQGMEVIHELVRGTKAERRPPQRRTRRVSETKEALHVR